VKRAATRHYGDAAKNWQPVENWHLRAQAESRGNPMEIALGTLKLTSYAKNRPKTENFEKSA
jgi:hypothetical protein